MNKTYEITIFNIVKSLSMYKIYNFIFYILCLDIKLLYSPFFFFYK